MSTYKDRKQFKRQNIYLGSNNCNLGSTDSGRNPNCAPIIRAGLKVFMGKREDGVRCIKEELIGVWWDRVRFGLHRLAWYLVIRQKARLELHWLVGNSVISKFQFHQSLQIGYSCPYWLLGMLAVWSSLEHKENRTCKTISMKWFRSGSTHVILHNDMDHLKGSFKGCEEPPRVPGPHFENYYFSWAIRLGVL